jgi:hypothetical protein
VFQNYLTFTIGENMANLQKVASDNLSISLTALIDDGELVRDVQEKLGTIGFLDPLPITLGTFTTDTDVAIQKFQKVARRSPTENIDASFARKLLDITKTIVVPAAPTDITIALSGSVGKDRKNIPGDILAVKNRLADLGFKVSRDASVDSTIIQSIKLFQAIINGRKGLDVGENVDGKIDVNGKTHQALQKSIAPRWQEMLPGSVQSGFLNSDFLAKEDNSDFGTTWMVEAVQAAGLIYKEKYLSSHPNAALIAVNDISKMTGGNFPPHLEHQVGLCCDLYLPRKDGNSGQITVGDDRYDRSAMRAILTAFRSQTKHKVVKILLNDTTLNNEGLCTLDDGHKDHAHVEIRPATLSMF